MHDHDEQDRIDFSPLDPSRDGARWNALIARTTARALAAKHPTIFGALSKWTVPLLSLAGLVMAGALALSLNLEPTSNPVDSFSEWANQGQVPQSVDVIQLAEENG